MPKACHVTSGHAVTDTRIVKRECALLRENGFTVSLVAQCAGPKEVDGIQIRSLPSVGPRWYQRCFLLLPILIKILMEDNDVIHFHDPDLLPIMWLWSFVTRKPVIWDAHEHYESVISQSNKFLFSPLSRMIGKIYSFLEIQTCRLAKARVVTVSEVLADRYRKAGIGATACANYVDHTSIPFPPRTKRSSPPLIIMTGTIRPAFSTTELLKAFSILKTKTDAKLAFWGDFSPAVRDQLIRHAAELKVADSVECAGPFPWEQLVTKLIPQASVAVYISDPNITQRRNELPNRIFEYWANGVPVVVAKGTLCGKLVSNVNGGLTVSYGSVPELAACLEQLVASPDSITALGKNGRQAVSERYNWTKEGPKLLGLYKSILGKGFPTSESSH